MNDDEQRNMKATRMVAQLDGRWWGVSSVVVLGEFMTSGHVCLCNHMTWGQDPALYAC